ETRALSDAPPSDQASVASDTQLQRLERVVDHHRVGEVPLPTEPVLFDFDPARAQHISASIVEFVDEVPVITVYRLALNLWPADITIRIAAQKVESLRNFLGRGSQERGDKVGPSKF